MVQQLGFDAPGIGDCGSLIANNGKMPGDPSIQCKE
jgi:hypothetical protein